MKDSYPLRMEEGIDLLRNATVFETFDANWGYWQTKMEDKSIPLTAFTCHKILLELTIMPFGLTNAPAMFQRALDIILLGFKWLTCLVVLDDVIVFSKSFEDHIIHQEELLNALRQSGVNLQIRKRNFSTDRLNTSAT